MKTTLHFSLSLSLPPSLHVLKIAMQYKLVAFLEIEGQGQDIWMHLQIWSFPQGVCLD